MGRNANHEGSVYKREDGRWCAALCLPGGRRKTAYAKTRAEASKKLTALLKAREDGLPVVSDRITVKAFLTDWLKTAKTTLRPRTHLRYEQLIRVHVIPVIGSVALSRLTPAQVQSLYTRALTTLAPATTRQIHAILHRAFRQGVQWGQLVRNPTDALVAPRVERHEMKYYDTAQAMALLDAARGDRLEALYALAVTAGLRQGELLGLRWSDIDLDNASAHVQWTLQRTPDGFVLAPPKTSRSRRTVALTGVAVDALRRHRVRQAQERLAIGGAWEQPEMVFTTEMGRYIDGGNLRYSFNPLMRRAGLPTIRFHDLRHSAATLLLAQGVPAKIVSDMLGHSTINITLDTYSHVTEGMQRQAASAMDMALGWGG